MSTGTEIIEQKNGKVKIMSGKYEIIFQRKGNGVKHISFINHLEGRENFVPSKFLRPARDKAEKVLL